MNKLEGSTHSIFPSTLPYPMKTAEQPQKNKCRMYSVAAQLESNAPKVLDGVVRKVTDENQACFARTRVNQGEVDNFRKYQVSPQVVFSAAAFGSESHITSVFAKVNDAAFNQAPFYWVDMMEETHFLLNGDGILYMNEANDVNSGKTPEETALLQKKIINGLQEQQTVVLHNRKKTKWVVDGIKNETVAFKAIDPNGTSILKVESEEACVTRHGGNYISLPITDHLHDVVVQRVDATVAKLKNIVNKDGWFHFHCHAGKGRASETIILAMILKYAKVKTFDEIKAIIVPQESVSFLKTALTKALNFAKIVFKALQKLPLYKIGHTNETLDQAKTVLSPNSKEKINEEKNMGLYIDFYRNFYAYCREDGPENISWTQWSKNKLV